MTDAGGKRQEPSFPWEMESPEFYGMDQAMYGEILLFENGLKGMVQDIKEDSIGCICWKGYRNQRRKPCVQDEEKSRNPSGRGVLWGA